MTREPAADAEPTLFVWAVWLGLSFLLWRFALDYSVNIPFLDDWEMVPVLAGEQPVTLKWLWSQHNEHRIFIPRLIYIAILKLSGGDFRAGVVFNVLTLSATAAALVLAARAIRGRTSYADAFFPLVLLHWGQAENLVSGFTMPLVLSSVVAACLLCVLMRPGPLGFRPALILALGTLALPLTSGSGLAFVPALAACTVLAGWDLHTSQPGSGRAWIAIVTAGVLGFVLCALYFVGYQRPPAHPPSPGLGATLQGTLQFLSLGFGTGTTRSWYASAYLTALLILATMLVLLWSLLYLPEERRRAVRALLFLGGMGCLAGGVAWSRIALSPGGIFSSRYATLAAPLLCCIYFAWEAVGSPRIARLVQMALFFFAAVFLLRNHDDGLLLANTVRESRRAVIADVESGMPLPEVASRHCGAIYICGTDVLLQRMQMLRDKGVGRFARLRLSNPPPPVRREGRDKPINQEERR